tara:strand:+ start:169 stop:564 length:396 start_codon:yes stop_codon:yes gene_type:complete
MRKLILILLFPILLFGQEREQTIPTPDDTTFVWKNGYEDLVDVKFEYLLQEKIDEEVLFYVVINVMTTSSLELKNRLSFVPRKLTLFKSEDGYRAITEYIGKNAYGTESLLKSYFSFIPEGIGDVELLYTR